MNYLGILLGYVLSGYLITVLGYSFCFSANAACYFIFAILVVATEFKNSAPLGDPLAETASHANAQQNNSSLLSKTITRELFFLTGILWLTGGSINVLEVEFAKKFMSASEMQISLLFFAAALGAIGFSILSEKRGIPVTMGGVRIATFLAGLSILGYVYIAQFPGIFPFLCFYGFSVAYHGYACMTLIQNHVPSEKLASTSVSYNTLTQVVTLTAAAAGVLVSSIFDSRIASISFSGITVAAGLMTLLNLGWQHEK